MSQLRPDDGRSHEDGSVGERPRPSGRTVRSGAIWGLGAQALQQILSIIATLILARLLLPSDFGIVALSVSVVGFVSLGLSLGWEASVVRRKEPNQRYLSTIFWTAAGLGVFFTLATVLAAEPLTSVLGLPEATPHVRVLAISLLLAMARTIPIGLILRRQQYRRHYAIQVSATVVLVAIEIVLAVAGAGAWAAIAGQVAMSSFMTIAAFLSARWYPRMIWASGELRGEVGFASNMLSSQATSYIMKNADYWIVSAVLGAASLGTYYIAYVLPSIIRMRFTQVAQTVLMPVFADSEDIHRRRRIYVQAMRLQIGLGFPAMVGLAALSEPLVRLFFGDGWLDAVEPLRWLALMALMDLFSAALAPLAIMCGGLSRLVLTQLPRLIVSICALVVVAVAVGTLESIAMVAFVSAALGAVTGQWFVARYVEVPFRLIARDCVAIATASVAMLVPLVGLLSALRSAPPALTLLLCAVIGAVVYFGFGRVVFPVIFKDLIGSVLKLVRMS